MAEQKPAPDEGTRAILDKVHQTLSSHNVTQPVQVRFGGADDGQCYEYRLVTDENGNPVYRMVPVPCGDLQPPPEES
jgi:hypothetical protein